MASHVLDLALPVLFGQLADHPTAFAVPLLDLLLLGVLDLAPVVLAVDGALAQLAGEDVVAVGGLVRQAGLTLR
jgi:hypothetical protein